MEKINVSLFASAVRPKLWESLLESLKSTSVSYEVIFSGFNTPEEIKQLLNKYLCLKYIHTARIKPSQNYEIARCNCTGETVVWIADDCEFPNDVIGKAYAYWKSQNNEKLILSIQTKESGYGLPQGQLFDMNMHRFFGYRTNTPLMAPLGLMSRKFLDELGGIDARYICGQYENDIVMRAIKEGGKVELFGDREFYIDIDHLGKSLAIGESKKDTDFLNRPFAKGYTKDREVLEASWTDFAGRVLIDRNDAFVKFKDKDIFIKSQNNNLPDMWE